MMPVTEVQQPAPQQRVSPDPSLKLSSILDFKDTWNVVYTSLFIQKTGFKNIHLNQEF